MLPYSDVSLVICDICHILIFMPIIHETSGFISVVKPVVVEGDLPPQGYSSMSGDIFSCHTVGKVQWHLADKATDAAKTFYKAWDRPQQRINQLQVSIRPKLRNRG